MAVLSAGKVAPPFEMTGTDSKKYSLKEALERGPVLAAFFKVECPTCQYTFPFVERLYQRFRAQDVQIWGISQDDARDSQRFAKEYRVTFPILIDKHPYKTSREYGLEYVPTLFLIAPDGHVELTSEGFCKVDLLALQKSLAKHLSTAPGELFQPSDKVPEYKPG